MSIDRIRKILGWSKNPSKQQAVKGMLASCFYDDGNLFIERFDLVHDTDSMANLYFRAKAFVDLIMSIECSLKSLILGLSLDSESAENAYKKAKGYSHNLDKLYSEVQKRAQKRLKIKKKNKLFDQIKKLKIDSRYAFEIWRIKYDHRKKHTPWTDSLLDETIHDDEWGIKLRNEACFWNNLASKCMTRYLDKHSGEPLSAEILNQLLISITKGK